MFPTKHRNQLKEALSNISSDNLYSCKDITKIVEKYGWHCCSASSSGEMDFWAYRIGNKKCKLVGHIIIYDDRMKQPKYCKLYK